MRSLEIRRHAMRSKPGKFLSQAGIDLARRVGNSIGPFDYVATSTLARGYETAIAMGFAVDRQIEELGVLPVGIFKEAGWPKPFAEHGRTLARDDACAAFAKAQAKIWREIIMQVPDGGSALIISHGLIIEFGAMGCLPNADYVSWGEAIGYCEGMQLTYDEGAFLACKMRRLGASDYLVEN